MNDKPFQIGDTLTITEKFEEICNERNLTLFRNPFRVTQDLIYDVEEGYLVKTQVVSESRLVKYANLPASCFKLYDKSQPLPALPKPKLVKPIQASVTQIAAPSEAKPNTDSNSLTVLDKKLDEIVDLLTDQNKALDDLSTRLIKVEKSVRRLKKFRLQDQEKVDELESNMKREIEAMRGDMAGKLTDKFEIVLRKKKPSSKATN